MSISIIKTTYILYDAGHLNLKTNFLPQTTIVNTTLTTTNEPTASPFILTMYRRTGANPIFLAFNFVGFVYHFQLDGKSACLFSYIFDAQFISFVRSLAPFLSLFSSHYILFIFLSSYHVANLNFVFVVVQILVVVAFHKYVFIIYLSPKSINYAMYYFVNALYIHIRL